jgi:hypothetical protein
MMLCQEELVEDEDLRKPRTDGLCNSYMAMSDNHLPHRDNELQHASDMSTESNNSSTVRVDVSHSHMYNSLSMAPLSAWM